MNTPTPEEVNALIERRRQQTTHGEEAYFAVSGAVAMLTALRDENARLKAAAPAWVPISERKPTKEDADEQGNVLWHVQPLGFCAVYRWDSDSARSIDYWQRLPAPPESAEAKQARADEEALQIEWTRHSVGGDSGRFANFCNGFRAALAHARKERATL